MIDSRLQSCNYFCSRKRFFLHNAVFQEYGKTSPVSFYVLIQKCGKYEIRVVQVKQQGNRTLELLISPKMTLFYINYVLLERFVSWPLRKPTFSPTLDSPHLLYSCQSSACITLLAFRMSVCLPMCQSFCLSINLRD